MRSRDKPGFEADWATVSNSESLALAFLAPSRTSPSGAGDSHSRPFDLQTDHEAEATPRGFSGGRTHRQGGDRSGTVRVLPTGETGLEHHGCHRGHSAALADRATSRLVWRLEGPACTNRAIPDHLSWAASWTDPSWREGRLSRSGAGSVHLPGYSREPLSHLSAGSEPGPPREGAAGRRGGARRGRAQLF